VFLSSLRPVSEIGNHPRHGAGALRAARVRPSIQLCVFTHRKYLLDAVLDVISHDRRSEQNDAHWPLTLNQVFAPEVMPYRTSTYTELIKRRTLSTWDLAKNSFWPVGL